MQCVVVVCRVELTSSDRVQVTSGVDYGWQCVARCSAARVFWLLRVAPSTSQEVTGVSVRIMAAACLSCEAAAGVVPVSSVDLQQAELVVLLESSGASVISTAGMVSSVNCSSMLTTLPGTGFSFPDYSSCSYVMFSGKEQNCNMISSAALYPRLIFDIFVLFNPVPAEYVVAGHAVQLCTLMNS